MDIERSPVSPVLGTGLSVSVADPDGRDLGGRIDAALQAGVTFVELPLYQLDLVVGGRIVASRLADVAAIVAGRGASYTLHGHLAINLMDEPERFDLHRRLLDANIEIAAALGAKHLVVHTGFTAAKTDAGIADAYARQREGLSSAGDAAAKAGLLLCVENVFAYEGERLTALPGELARELSAIAHPHVAATFDFSHGHIYARVRGADFTAEAVALAPFARHLHVHDSFGRPMNFWLYSLAEALAFGAGDLHLPPGWGSVPFAEIAATCRFPSGVVANLELNDRYWSELSPAIAETKAFAAAIRTDNRGPALGFGAPGSGAPGSGAPGSGAAVAFEDGNR